MPKFLEFQNYGNVGAGNQTSVGVKEGLSCVLPALNGAEKHATKPFLDSKTRYVENEDPYGVQFLSGLE